MSIVTTCPGCNTTFRVRHEDLQASEGRVRCGQCTEIFNALDSLATLDDVPDPVRETVLQARPTPQKNSDPITIPKLQNKISGMQAKP
ncbi:MAG: zinc-ribbon domain-containing protein, partial [Burkholderiales bacterium]